MRIFIYKSFLIIYVDTQMNQNLKRLYNVDNWWKKVIWSEIEYDVKKIQEQIFKTSKRRVCYHPYSHKREYAI